MSVEKYRDFLDYWDSRFDENEKILNNYPQLANFAFRECNKVWNMLIHDYAALLARHDALVEAVAWERAAERVERKAKVASRPSYDVLAWASDNLTKARAEVDRLLQEASNDGHS